MFDEVIVMGAGTVAQRCALIVKEKKMKVSFLEKGNNQALSSRRFCEIHEIPFITFSQDEEIEQCLLESKGRVLIVSASNRFIFPSSLSSKSTIKIMNYHGALLPKHPGRNAEAWTIWENDTFGGITWHWVVQEIDSGEILIQKRVELDTTISSFSLLRIYSRLATESFSCIIDDVLMDHAISIPQDGQRGEIHYSWQKPNNGELDLTWDGGTVVRFLRAMDYGPLRTLGYSYFYVENKKYQVLDYSVRETSQVKQEVVFDLEHGSCILYKDQKVITMNIHELV